eukprot:bmy_05445T0
MVGILLMGLPRKADGQRCPTSLPSSFARTSPPTQLPHPGRARLSLPILDPPF